MSIKKGHLSLKLAIRSEVPLTVSNCLWHHSCLYVPHVCSPLRAQTLGLELKSQAVVSCPL